MNKQDSICAGIVTYNPDLERLQENVDAVKHNGISHIVVVDNGSRNYSDIYKRFHSKGLYFVSNQKNMGIAYALNQIFETAVGSFNSDWVLTLDQDSVIDDSMIDTYLSYLKPGIVSLCSLYRDRAIKEDAVEFSLPETEQVDFCITSGNMVRAEAWREVGGFDNRLFIDLVDHEFCFRLRERGYTIMRINKQLMLHELGHQTPIKWFWKTCYTDNYSAMRDYYISRNTHYVYRDYPQYAHYSRRTGLLRRFIKILLYESDKRRKLISILKGVWDSRKLKRTEFVPWRASI